ncbi:MAG: DUF5718 family protein [Planctomycetota bacterium]
MIDLTQVIGFGVAGNFTGHLEQAGEASDFVNIAAAAGAPKGVFPFYVPPAAPEDDAHFLHTFPLSADTIEHPGTIQGQAANLQIEPELALLCALDYDEQHRVTAVRPTHAAAYNDCSTRRPDATKISQKKNWGANTKGLASDQWLPLDSFDDAGVLQHFRVACYLLRDGQLHPYGEDSPVAGPDGYGYMYQQLLDWLIDRLNTQQDEGPLEDLSHWLAVAGHPHHAVVSIGATRYTPLGETTYLQPGDESIVLAYDQRLHQPAGLEAAMLQDDSPLRQAPTCSLLRQRVMDSKS